MRIEPGRIIWVDMGQERWGKVLYMVINPPIVCETCGAVVFEWRQDAGEVICPDCGNAIRERTHCPCPKCGEDDYHTLRVVANNNWHYEFLSDTVTEMNDKRGRVINICGKSLQESINKQRVILYDKARSDEIKRKILWTSSMDYDSSKQMPDEIKNAFR